MRITILALSLALGGCMGAGRGPSSAGRMEAEAGAVYAVLLDSMRQHPPGAPLRHRWVQVETVPGPGNHGFEASLAHFPEFTPALQQAFHAASQRVLNVRAVSRRDEMEWISRDSLERVYRRMRDHLGAGPYPFTATRFTAVGFSEDGGTALLYVDYWCGLRCGEGYWALLTRQADGRWILRRTLQTMVS